MAKKHKRRTTRRKEGIEIKEVKKEPLSDNESCETHTGVSTSNKSSKNRGSNRRDVTNNERVRRRIEELRQVDPTMKPWVPASDGGGKKIRQDKAAQALYSNSSSSTEALS